MTVAIRDSKTNAQVATFIKICCDNFTDVIFKRVGSVTHAIGFREDSEHAWHAIAKCHTDDSFDVLIGQCISVARLAGVEPPYALWQSDTTPTTSTGSTAPAVATVDGSLKSYLAWRASLAQN